MSFEDYEILNTLTNNQQTNIFKVRNKLSNDFYMLHVVNLENNQNLNKEIITKKIKQRQLNTHPNLLLVHTVITDQINNTLEILTDYCYYGNLNNLIENCLKESKFLEETTIYKILFQLLCAIKTIENYSLNHFNMNEIFLDSDFNIKLLDCDIIKNKDQKNVIKISQLGMIIYQLCTLKPYYNSEQEEIEFKKIQLYYSSQFLLFLKEILKDSSNLMKKLDKIVSNPTILLKCSQWRKDKIFFTINTNNNNPSDQISNSETYLLKLQKLRSREIAVQAKERKLNEKEYLLSKREKELILMQRILKEKLSRAEIYLKTCRDGSKSMISSNKSNLKTKKSTADSSLTADCSDLNVVTSKKLIPNNNPTGFSRSYSERRVKFKGHSPLKDIEYNKRKSLRVKKKKLPLKEIPENNISLEKLNLHEYVMYEENKLPRTNKKLFDDVKVGKETICERDKGQENIHPISWTNENKKFAFDLLKIINNSTNGYNCQNDVKHTYL